MLAYIKDEGLGNLADASLTVKGSKNKVTKVIDDASAESVSEGDEIAYTVTAEYPYYSADVEKKTFTATDNLTNATFKENSLEIKVAGVNTALVPKTDYTVNEYKDTASLEIAFIYNPDYAGKTVTIKYTAIVGAGEGNVTNKIESNFDTEGDSVTSAKVKLTVVKEGKDVTIVAYHRALLNCIKAAEEVEKEQGISVEIIDPIVLRPLDISKMVASVKKTGRCLIVHEAYKIGGFGMQISEEIAENELSDLKKPIVRLGGKEQPIPFGIAG